MKKALLLLLFVAGVSGLSGQSRYWELSEAPGPVAHRRLHPAQAAYFRLDYAAASRDLLDASRRKAPLRLRLPMPDGSMPYFVLTDSPVMEPGLAAKYPDIRTFLGHREDNPRIWGRFDITPAGFHGYVLGMQSPVIIDPVSQDDPVHYQVLYRKDLPQPPAHFYCELENEAPDNPAGDPSGGAGAALLTPRTESVQLRTYRLALATTGEYSIKFGSNKASILAEVVTAINRVNSITERDFAVHLNLIDNTDTLFFMDPNTDPYTNGNTQAMINENPQAISQFIPLNDYDMGHVFGTGGGGLAQLQSVCTGARARGVTSAGHLDGDEFYVDYVAHEMGHQFGANHTFNNCSGFAGGNENAGTAYEPGSGSTIMSYSGACGANNIQFDSDPYYHVASLMEITDYMINGFGSSCAVKTDANNHYPVAEIPLEDGFYIPIRTAFMLQGIGSDEDGDSLSYNWEEFDLGPLSPIGNPQGNVPIFRSVPPNPKPYRFFPRLATIYSGSTDIKELLPTYSRDLTFQFVVRDNHPGGGAAAWARVAFHATADAGPFVVTSPGLSDNEWEVGEYAEVTWNVANTDQAPVNCQWVNIRLVHGFDYDNSILLGTHLPNSGTAYVQVPSLTGTGYHLIVEAADNVFLDAATGVLSIVDPVTPRLSAGISVTALKMCLPETDTVTIGTAGLGGYTGQAHLAVTGTLPTGAIVALSDSVVTAGTPVSLYLDFTQVTDYAPVDLQVVVTDDNGVDITLPLHLELSDFDFSALATVAPANGAVSVPIFPQFEWPQLAAADTYEMQVASNPAFDSTSLVFGKSGMTGHVLQLPVDLEPGSVYYWRVRALNSCGVGEWTLPAAFATAGQNCGATPATDVPLIISSGSPSTKTSVIHINSAGTVNDLNVKNLKGQHGFMSDLSIRLIAPSGESAYLMKNQCGNVGASFNLSFDDDAINSPCQMQGKVKPYEALSVFQGVGTQGDWTLEVHDNTSGGGGSITGWSIELCSDAVLSPPVLVHNEVLMADNGVELAITPTHLQVTDADNAPVELVYTLVSQPQFGMVKKWGIPLQLGEHFTQFDIDYGDVTYYNWPGDHPADEFLFAVTDGQGGLVPVTAFHIQIGPVATGDVEQTGFVLYPNPAADRVTVQFDNDWTGRKQLRLSDVTGRVIRQVTVADKQYQWYVGDLPPGVYFVQVSAGDRRQMRKLVVE